METPGFLPIIKNKEKVALPLAVANIFFFFCVPLDGEAHEVEWLRHSHTHVSEFCRPALKLSWLSKEARLPARAFLGGWAILHSLGNLPTL